MYSKRKAQSIIEVLVAMTLITVVLGSTFTLISRAVSLVMVAKSRTEAVEMAQKGLAEAVLVLQGECSINNTTDWQKLDKVVNGKTLDVEKRDLIDTNPSLDYADSFTKITATVTWNDRGTPGQTLAISQYVRISTP